MSIQEANQEKADNFTEKLPKETSKSKKRTPEEIEEWLINYIAQILEIEPDEIDVTVPYERYGLDSAAGITLTGDLGEWLGLSIDPSMLYDYPTIESSVEYLTQL